MIKLWRKLGLYGIIVKVLIFLTFWLSALMTVDYFIPSAIEWSKLVTNIFSNTLVFMVGYVLTVLGYRYTKREKKEKKDKS